MRRNSDYGSEGELLPINGGSVYGMANGNGNGGRVNWDAIRIAAQYLIYPIAMSLVYLVLQNSSLASRLAIIEYAMTRPTIDIEMVKRVAVNEDRLNRVTDSIKEINLTLDTHREKSTYDKGKSQRSP